MMSELQEWHVVSQELLSVIERRLEDGRSAHCNEIPLLHLVEVSGALMDRAFAIG